MGRPHRAPHQIPRYAPVVRLLRTLPPGARVLEIGSGSEGIATWWRRPFVGLDLHFDYRMARNLRPVFGDATRTPFPDDTFDLVVCVAVLVHLEGDGTVEQVCSEIGRVTRGRAVIVTPCGDEANRSDLRMLDWSRARGFEPKQWLLDQIARGPLDGESVTQPLARYGHVRIGTTLSVPWNERFFRAEQRMRQLRGTMTAAQPLLRGWGWVAGRELDGGGAPYERSFVLSKGETSSPPRASS